MKNTIRLVLTTVFFFGISIGIFLGFRCLDGAESVFHEFVGLFIIYGCMQASFLYVIVMYLAKLCQVLDN